MNNVEHSTKSAGNLICNVSRYGQAAKLLNVKNSRNRRMSAMVVEKDALSYAKKILFIKICSR